MALTTTLAEPEVRTVLEWDPDSCKNAETSADTGELATAADLCERILADDRVEGVMLQRASISRLPLDFEGGSEAAVKRLRDDGDFWRICPLSQLASLHRWYAMFGIALGRLVWATDSGKARIRDGLNAPLVEAWSTPRNLSRSISGGWECTLSTGGRQPVVGGTDGWLLWTRPGSRPWTSAAWRACRLWWLLKQYAIQDWARYSERHGQGTWVLKPGEGTDLASKEQRATLAKEFRDLGRQAVAILRPKWDAALIESSANNFQTFSKQIEAANTGIAIALLGQNLSSEVQGGSYAAANTHAAVAASIIASDAEALSDFVHDQILAPWAKANYGSADAAPWPVWNATPPADTQSRVKAWVDLGTALTAFKALGVPVDVIAVCEEAGLPLEAGAEPSIAPDEDDGDPEQTTPDAGSGASTDETDLTEDETDEDDELSVSDVSACGHFHIRAEAHQKPGERSGQDYTDRVAASLRAALAADLAPHLDELVRIVGTAEGPRDYARVRYAIEDYYREKMSPEALAEKVRAGLTMAQTAGWAAVRVDAPELSK